MRNLFWTTRSHLWEAFPFQTGMCTSYILYCAKVLSHRSFLYILFPKIQIFHGLPNTVPMQSAHTLMEKIWWNTISHGLASAKPETQHYSSSMGSFWQRTEEKPANVQKRYGFGMSFKKVWGVIPEDCMKKFQLPKKVHVVLKNNSGHSSNPGFSNSTFIFWWQSNDKNVWKKNCRGFHRSPVTCDMKLSFLTIGAKRIGDLLNVANTY